MTIDLKKLKRKSAQQMALEARQQGQLCFALADLLDPPKKKRKVGK